MNKTQIILVSQAEMLASRPKDISYYAESGNNIILLDSINRKQNNRVETVEEAIRIIKETRDKYRKQNRQYHKYLNYSKLALLK